MKRLGTIMYILFNFIIGFCLSYGKIGKMFVNRKSVLWIMILLLYIFLPIGTIIGGSHFIIKRTKGNDNFFLYILKSFFVVFMWPIIAIYFLMRSWWDGLGKHELINMYGNWLLYLEINTYQLLIFWTNSVFLYKEKIIYHTYTNYMRVKEYLNWEIGIGISFIVVVLLFINPQHYSEYASMYDIRERFLIYPFIILIWMYIQKEVTKYCIWNYDWEKTYANELKENGIAPNIETVPFPN